MIKSYKTRRVIANTFVYLLLAGLGLIWISPLVYLVLHSFRDEGLAYVTYLLPKKYSFQNYIDPVHGRYRKELGRLPEMVPEHLYRSDLQLHHLDSGGSDGILRLQPYAL